MNRRVVIVLLGAVVVGVLGAWLWSGFQQAMWAHSLIHAGSTLRAVPHLTTDDRFEGEELEAYARESVLVPEDTEAIPTLLLLSATARLDEATREAFGQPISLHPLPGEAGIPYDEHRQPTEAVTVTDEFGRSVVLRTEGIHGSWRADLTPFVDPNLTLAQAEAMRAELEALADRVKAGEFSDHAEVEAAAKAAMIRGAIRSMAPSPATRPGEG